MADERCTGGSLSSAKAELVGDHTDERFARLEKEDRIEQLLLAIKKRKGLTA